MKSLQLLLLLPMLCSAAAADVPSISVRVAFSPSVPNRMGELLAISKSGAVTSSGWQPLGVYTVSASAAPATLFFYQGPGSDTLYVGSVAARDTAVQVHFPLPLRKNLLGHYRCPKCHKADKTVAILHSEAPQVRVRITATDTTYSSIIGRKKYEGCLNGGGKAYCQRDKIRF